MAHPTRIFKTEEDLLRAWHGYKLHVLDQSEEWLKLQYVGKDGARKEDPQKIPLTFEGFKRYCYPIFGLIEQYFTNQGGYYEDFIGVCSYIKNEIREDQIIGGLLGFYNPSITQRLNGLKEHTESNVSVNHEVPLFPDVSTDDSN